MQHIIGIGNRYIKEDAAGPMVIDILAERQLPADVKIIDGGLGGLNLLGLIDGLERVVFIDSVCGFSPSQAVMVLTPQQLGEQSEKTWGHAAGLSYLIQFIPVVCEKKVPEIMIIGIEGIPDQSMLEHAAQLGLNITSEKRS